MTSGTMAMVGALAKTRPERRDREVLLATSWLSNGRARASVLIVSDAGVEVVARGEGADEAEARLALAAELAATLGLRMTRTEAA